MLSRSYHLPQSLPCLLPPLLALYPQHDAKTGTGQVSTGSNQPPRPLACTPSHSAHSGLTQNASGTCMQSLALAVVRRCMCVYACTMSLWRFAFPILPLTNWDAAELNHPKPGQRAERGNDLGSRMSCPSRPVLQLRLGTSHTHTTQPHCRFIHIFTLVGAICFSAPSPNSLGPVRATNGLVPLDQHFSGN